MFCTNCGSKVPAGSQFCTNCGAKAANTNAGLGQQGGAMALGAASGFTGRLHSYGASSMFLIACILYTAGSALSILTRQSNLSQRRKT